MVSEANPGDISAVTAQDSDLDDSLKKACELHGVHWVTAVNDSRSPNV